MDSIHAGGAEVASGARALEDAGKRLVVARLRERYGAARELMTLAQPYSNLEWILGASRDPQKDDASFDRRVSELVVLWLQDLTAELEGGAGPAEPFASRVRSRNAVAESLRMATGDFAEAFLSPS